MATMDFMVDFGIYIHMKKSLIRETLKLLTDADSITIAMKRTKPNEGIYFDLFGLIWTNLDPFRPNWTNLEKFYKF